MFFLEFMFEQQTDCSVGLHFDDKVQKFQHSFEPGTKCNCSFGHRPATIAKVGWGGRSAHLAKLVWVVIISPTFKSRKVHPTLAESLSLLMLSVEKDAGNQIAFVIGHADNF